LFAFCACFTENKYDDDGGSIRLLVGLPLYVALICADRRSRQMAETRSIDDDNASLKETTDCRDDGTIQDRTTTADSSTHQTEHRDRTSERESNNCRTGPASADTDPETSSNGTVEIIRYDGGGIEGEVAEIDDAAKDESMLAADAVNDEQEDAIGSVIRQGTTDNVEESGRCRNAAAAESATTAAHKDDTAPMSDLQPAPQSIRRDEDYVASQKREPDTAATVDGGPVTDVADDGEHKVHHESSPEVASDAAEAADTDDAGAKLRTPHAAAAAAQVRDDEDDVGRSDRCELEGPTAADATEKTEENATVTASANSTGNVDSAAADAPEQLEEISVTASTAHSSNVEQHDSEADAHLEDSCVQKQVNNEQHAMQDSENVGAIVASDEVSGKYADVSAAQSSVDADGRQRAAEIVGVTELADENDSTNACERQIARDKEIDSGRPETGEQEDGTLQSAERVQENSAIRVSNQTDVERRREKYCRCRAEVDKVTDVKESVDNGHMVVEADSDGAAMSSNSEDERTIDRDEKVSCSRETGSPELDSMPLQPRRRSEDADIGGEIRQDDTEAQTTLIGADESDDEIVTAVDVVAMTENDSGEGDDGAGYHEHGDYFISICFFEFCTRMFYSTAPPACSLLTIYDYWRKCISLNRINCIFQYITGSHYSRSTSHSTVICGSFCL